MPSPPNLTNITPPRVPLVDERTGLISREWYRFFLNLFNLTGGGNNTASLTDLQLGPPAPQQENLTDIIIDVEAIKVQPTEESANEQIAELQKQVEGLAATPIPALGTFAALQQANLPWTTFDTTPQSVPTDVGTLAWDGSSTLGLQASANVIYELGEAEFTYIKASATITKGQLCYHTGSVGSSGVITAAPTPLALADPNQIVGVAAESIALNGFGLIQVSGTLRGFDTTGSSVSEAWADGDPLYYNPSYVGSFTKTKPSAPNQKTYIGEVINAGPGSSGSISIRIVPGSVLGGTDSNVQITSVADKDLLQYDSVLQYWKNVPASTLPVGTATNLAGGLAGSLPYQSAPSTTTFLGIGASGRWLGSSGTAPQWNAPAALTKTDDTNVTLTLGGSATTALLNAASLTLGWTGQLGLSRGGTNASLTASAGSVAYSTASALALNTAGNSGDWLKSAGTAAPTWTAPAALTKTDDTNVTLTLGGSASTALLNAASLTLGWTGHLAVSRGGTGLSSGTSGGVLYYSAAGTLASSAVLAANALVIGGGAGVAPSTITTGTGVVTALGVNTGTAGSFVVNGGALGTPLSGTVTNLTGTASININGTVGATTPTTGSFTNITGSANAVIEVTDNTNAALRVTQLGTGNALLIEDATNPDSTPFVIDASGKVIVGATTAPPTVETIAPLASLSSAAGATAAQDFGIYNYQNAGGTARIRVGSKIFFARSRSGTVGSLGGIVSSGDILGQMRFSGDDGAALITGAEITAEVDGTPALNDMPGRLVFSTTAAAAASPTERMRIDRNGYLGVGVTAPAARLHLGGAITAAAWTTNGIGLRYAAATYTDSSSSGTVASVATHAIAQPTLAASSSTTYTNAANVYIANAPTNGSNVTITNALALWVDNGTTRLDGNITYGGLIATQASAPTVASAATIAPTTPILFVSGTTQINTITAPAPISANGGQITLIPTGLWTTGTTGNIALASTAVVSKALIMTYDATTTKWYPSY